MLLGPSDPPPFEVLHPQGRSPFVLVCDHAGRAIPARLGDLGVSESERARHIASDLGIAPVVRLLAQVLDAFAILQTYSRLVIDANRPPGSPESIVTLSERTPIPGNEALSDAARRVREDAIFWPYQRRIGEEVERRSSTGALVLVALHSFTPTYKDVARRWHAGVLYGRDTRMAMPMLAALRREGALHIGDNEPYAVSDATDFTVITHAERRGLPYVELEIRQDLIADAPGQRAWADRLAAALRESLATL